MLCVMGWFIGFSGLTREMLTVTFSSMNREFVSNVWCIKILSPQEVQQVEKEGLKILNSGQIQEPVDSSYETYTPSCQESMNLSNGVTAVSSLEY